MFSELVAEARALVETMPTSAAAQATLPLATRWLLVLLRKDTKAREKLLDGVEGVMETLVERLATPARHAAPPPTKKGKKGARAPEPLSAPASPAFDVKSMTPQELVARTVTELDKNNSSVISDALGVLRYEEAFEAWLLEVLNKHVRVANGLGPWSCFADIGAGEMTVRIRIAGEEQDEGIEHPGDTDDDEIARTFKTVLGAASANFNWALSYTPRAWGFPSGDKYTLNYQGTAEFKYRDGQAALFATGNKVWLPLAEKVLVRASEE